MHIGFGQSKDLATGNAADLKGMLLNPANCGDARQVLRGGYSIAMSSVLEIERAIEQLPAKQVLQLGEWLDEQRAMLAASASVLALHDEEEGKGQQWED
jgi:hypothetical protein